MGTTKDNTLPETAEMQTTDYVPEQPNYYYLESRKQLIEDEVTSDLFRKLIELQPHCSLAYTWDDIGMATLVASLYGDKIRYCPQYAEWYIWDDSRWEKQIDAGIIMDKLQTVLNLMVLYCDEMEEMDGKLNLKDYRKYIMSIRKNTSMKNILEVLKTQVRITATEFDANPYILNTPVCAYDLRTMEIIQAREELNLTQVTNCNLKPGEAQCERWYKFIDEIMCGNREQAAFLQRALGYSLLGVNREECMFIALGSQTRNGKGTLFSSILNVLGKEYAQGSDPSLICEAKNGKSTDFNSPQPALRKLVNCRMVTMSESQRDVRLDAASMKAMTGRDTLTTRGLYEGSFDFIPQFTMWLNTNYLPAVTDDTVFKSDRIWVIKFDAFFDESKRDLDLKQLFSDPKNQPTILQWLIDGCQDYILHGLNPPECVRENTMEYRDKFDRVGNFLRECTTSDPTYKSKIVRGELYALYRAWCCKAENHYNPIGSTSFYTELSLRGYQIKKADGDWCVFGIKAEKPKSGVIQLT